jgi:hypothetical protein
MADPTIRTREVIVERNEEVRRISKKEFDSLCPFCNSRAIFRIGEHKLNSHGSYWHPDHPKARIEEWKCAVCFRVFILF